MTKCKNKVIFTNLQINFLCGLFVDRKYEDENNKKATRH